MVEQLTHNQCVAGSTPVLNANWIAQMVEQLTQNQCVAGSTPVPININHHKIVPRDN